MNAQPLAWDDLAHLLAVARTGSLTAAASRLGVHHATVLRRIARLEEALGTRLFDRGPTGYVPTAAGEEALAHARRVEDEVLALERAMIGRDLGLSGAIRITTTEDLVRALVPHLRSFREAHPRIRLTIDPNDRVYDLARREADVAIRAVARPPEYAVGRRIWDLAWAPYAAVGHADSCWIGFTDDLAHLSAARWLRAQVPDEDVMVRAGTVAGVAHLVRGGLGVGLLPCFLGDVEPELERRGPVIEDVSDAVWLLVHADLRRTARVRAFLDFAWERLRGEADLFEGRLPRVSPRGAG